ncbi:MAG: 7-carboxy-7-deazaguanine synthase QueE [Chitinivibrionia bacterium]|nr:7-carboxy-7-deazaguanine synthase QueE [Chitinivibrionia bacterium]
MLKISEIFVSIQGEGTRTGELCAFFRLWGCSFGCNFCDTKYANEGEYQEFSVYELLLKAKLLDVKLVQITGGEPLEQLETPQFAKKLIESGFTVLIETNGSKNIENLPKEAIKIVDVKLPWVSKNGEKEHFCYENLQHLSAQDELKFVIDSEDGYNWAKNFIETHKIPCKIIFSPCTDKIEPKTLAEMIIRDKLNVRFGMQLHKILWGNKRGV